jgi:hypothetical protein
MENKGADTLPTLYLSLKIFLFIESGYHVITQRALRKN